MKDFNGHSFAVGLRFIPMPYRFVGDTIQIKIAVFEAYLKYQCIKSDSVNKIVVWIIYFIKSKISIPLDYLVQQVFL